MSTVPKWQKSTFSEGDGPQCIELARHKEGIGLRESDAPEVILHVGRASLRTLLRQIKTGSFSHLT